MRTRVNAARVLPDAEHGFAPGAVVWEDDRLLYVGPAGVAPAADTTIDLPEAVVTPGLVNAHSHLDLTHRRGAVPYEGDFALWLEAVVAARGEEGVREAAERGLREAIARGTTTFGDVAAPRTARDMVAVFGKTGARARLFVEAVGFRPAVADEVWARVWELVEMQDLPANVVTAASPHAPYSVSRELLGMAVAMADGHRRPLAVHVGETLEELAFLRHGIGPLRELVRRLGADDPDFEPYGSIPDFLRVLEMKRAPLVLVHCNYVRPRDVPVGAFVVYCPTAHRFFGHPEHPVLEFLEEGVRVALGSDSAASGDSVDLLSETQHLAVARSDLRPRAVFRMATDWGARALDLNTGVLEPGRLADLAAFTPALEHEVLGHAETRCVLTVIGGNILHRAGE